MCCWSTGWAKSSYLSVGIRIYIRVDVSATERRSQLSEGAGGGGVATARRKFCMPHKVLSLLSAERSTLAGKVNRDFWRHVYAKPGHEERFLYGAKTVGQCHGGRRELSHTQKSYAIQYFHRKPQKRNVKIFRTIILKQIYENHDVCVCVCVCVCVYWVHMAQNKVKCLLS
jgi:hypothetical protein